MTDTCEDDTRTFIGHCNHEDDAHNNDPAHEKYLDSFLDWVDTTGAGHDFMAGDEVTSDVYKRIRREYDTLTKKDSTEKDAP